MRKFILIAAGLTCLSSAAHSECESSCNNVPVSTKEQRDAAKAGAIAAPTKAQTDAAKTAECDSNCNVKPDDAELKIPPSAQALSPRR